MRRTIHGTNGVFVEQTRTHLVDTLHHFIVQTVYERRTAVLPVRLPLLRRVQRRLDRRLDVTHANLRRQAVELVARSLLSHVAHLLL